MKKLLLVILVLIITASAAQAESDYWGNIVYELDSIIVDTDDGKYIKDVFSKYDATVYEEKFKQQLTANLHYLFDQGKLASRLGLARVAREDYTSLQLDQYHLSLDWNDNLKLEAGNNLKPQISNYILSTKTDDDLRGITAEYNRADFNIRPVYMREDENLQNFNYEVDIYGLQSGFDRFEELQVESTLLETRPAADEQINKQRNYLLKFISQPLSTLEMEIDLGRSVIDDPAYIDTIAGNLALLNLTYDFNPNLETRISYENINELYSPIRTTEFKQGYAFRETDYNQGYKMEVDYKLIEDLNSVFKLEYSDFHRTNSYLQPYLEDQDLAANIEDDRIKTYQAGVVTETASWYSRLFYTRENTTNDTSGEIKVDPEHRATENEELENEYSPGYKDRVVNVIHLYGRYNLLREDKYQLDIDGRFVWSKEDNKYHNFNQNFGNEITEKTFILGISGSYQWTPSLDTEFNYNIEQKEIDFLVDNNMIGDARGRQHSINLDAFYQVRENTRLNLNYQYYKYNLVDYTPVATDNPEINNSEVYRYYDEDFNRQEIKLNLQYRF